MDSWRDTASEEAQQAVDDLFNSALELAGKQVGKQGGFLPFALTQTADGAGSVEMVGDDVDSFQMIDTLWTGLREQREGVVAVAVVADVRLADDRFPTASGSKPSIVMASRSRSWRRTAAVACAVPSSSASSVSHRESVASGESLRY